MSHHRHRGLAAAVLLGLVVSLAACGSDSKSSSTTEAAPTTEAAVTTEAAGTTAASGSSTPGTASAELCAARDDLQSSITDLKDVNLSSGTAGVQAAITKIKDNVATLKSTAGDDLQPQVTALQDALTDLETALKNVSSGGMAAVISAGTKVATTGAALLTALQGLKCS